MKQDEAEKLARKWFVDNGIGFDGARIVKLTQFIREIENAAYERAAAECEKAARLTHFDDWREAYDNCADALRALITPAKTADTEG